MIHKERITVAISLIALGLSVFATVKGEFDASAERDRSMKIQLSDTLSRINQLGLRNAEALRDYADDPAYLQMVSGILNQENAFLLNQATYLANQIPALVSSVEYNTIAVAYANAGQMLQAERFHQLALSKPESPYLSSLARRSYAWFLFTQGRVEEGRQSFRQALAEIGGQGDLAHFTNVVTYQSWAEVEYNSGADPARVAGLLGDAERELAAIVNGYVRNSMGSALMAKRAQLLNELPPTAAGPAPIRSIR